MNEEDACVLKLREHMKSKLLILHYSLSIQRLQRIINSLNVLEVLDSPPVSSFTFFNKKGVISAPLIPFSSASYKAYLIAA